MIASMFWIIAGIVYLIYKAVMGDKKLEWNSLGGKAILVIITVVLTFFSCVVALDEYNPGKAFEMTIVLILVVGISFLAGRSIHYRVKERKKTQIVESCDDETVKEYCRGLRSYGVKYGIEYSNGKLELYDLLQMPHDWLYDLDNCRFLTVSELYIKISSKFRSVLSNVSEETLCDYLGLKFPYIPYVPKDFPKNMRKSVIESFVISSLGLRDTREDDLRILYAQAEYCWYKDKFKIFLEDNSKMQKIMQDTGYHLGSKAICMITYYSNKYEKYREFSIDDLYKWACETYFYELNELHTHQLADIIKSNFGKYMYEIEPAEGEYGREIKKMYIIDYTLRKEGLELLEKFIDRYIPAEEMQRYHDYAEVFKKGIGKVGE